MDRVEVAITKWWEENGDWLIRQSRIMASPELSLRHAFVSGMIAQAEIEGERLQEGTVTHGK